MSILTETLTLPENVCEDNRILVAIDVGSTQTRSSIYTKKGDTGEVILLDSNYEILTRDISHVNSNDTKVISNLEMFISDLTEEKDKFVFKNETHILKGELLSNITNARQITASSVSKVDQEATYINIISNTAIAVLDWFRTFGVIKGIPEVKLTVALPPEDTKFKNRTTLFLSRLAGTYQVAFPRLNVTITFSISKESRIISEPEAVSVLLTATKQITDEDADTVICVLDIGGRSTGITFIDNKALLTDSCVTVPVGGSRLLSLIGRNVATTYNIQEPTSARLIKALQTGSFKIGSRTVDITKDIVDAKREFANLIFSELLGAIDLNNIQMQNIAKVFCSGRTFTDADNVTPLIDIFAEICSGTSEYTEFKKVDADTPILIGLIYHGVIYA